MRRGWGEVQPLLNNHVTTQPRNQKQGFSLIELSIVLVIIGIVLASTIPLASAHVNVKKIETTRDKLELIHKALNVHAKINKDLPCPASRTALPGTATFGVETDCEAAPVAGVTEIGTDPDYIRIGTVPVRTLNLPEHMMFDSWSNRFTYAVTKAATNSVLPAGIIDIVDENGNPVTTPPASAAYVVFSSGKDGKGTHRRRGEATAACNTSAKDGENCDNDITFRDMSLNDGDVTAQYFDDLVLWRTTPTIKDEIGALGGGSSGGGGETEVAGDDWSSFRGFVANNSDNVFQWLGYDYQFLGTEASDPADDASGRVWNFARCRLTCHWVRGEFATPLFDPEGVRSYIIGPGGEHIYKRVNIPNGISRVLISFPNSTSGCSVKRKSATLGDVTITSNTSVNLPVPVHVAPGDYLFTGNTSDTESFTCEYRMGGWQSTQPYFPPNWESASAAEKCAIDPNAIYHNGEWFPFHNPVYPYNPYYTFSASCYLARKGDHAMCKKDFTLPNPLPPTSTGSGMGSGNFPSDPGSAGSCTVKIQFVE